MNALKHKGKLGCEMENHIESTTEPRVQTEPKEAVEPGVAATLETLNARSSKILFSLLREDEIRLVTTYAGNCEGNIFCSLSTAS